MSPRDRLIAVFVAVLWGCNFLAIHATISHFPPLLATGLRWLVLAVPTLLFVPWPKARPIWLLGYGLGFGTLQFVFLFIGMDVGMPTGLASLMLQASAPFTVLLGAALLRERVSRRQLAGIVVAVAGMAVIAWQRAENAALLPAVLVLLGALSWAFGNLASRKALGPDNPHGGDVNPIHLMLWMSVVPPVPSFALSLAVEDTGEIGRSLATVGSTEGLIALGGLAYIALAATLLGTGLWTALMRRYPAGVVAPFSLLVPVVGMSTAFVVLGERPTWIEIGAGVVVVAGVLLGSYARRQPAVASAVGMGTSPEITSKPRFSVNGSSSAATSTAATSLRETRPGSR
ncbi:EamA family transporter [Amycolatopsis suaedae]|uniref:EamA family transporter n=1 Tax=Amycolatopsis suaedae TaxID=2510978 RepID=UPI001F0FF2AA|nr:EamA family transporter [Amycolatopsis suaedae]